MSCNSCRNRVCSCSGVPNTKEFIQMVLEADSEKLILNKLKPVEAKVNTLIRQNENLVFINREVKQAITDINEVKETKEELLDSIATSTEAINNNTDTINSLVADVEKQVSDAILNSGYVVLDSFETGNTIYQRNEVLKHELTGKIYRWAGKIPKVVPTSSTPTSSGGFGTNAWLEVSDTTLRQDLASPQKWKDTIKGLPFVTPEMFGAKGDGVAIDSYSLDATVQAAGVGGTIVLSPSKTYKIMKSINLLAGQTLVGNGGTIKRIKQAHTVTTKAHAAGDKTFQVDSTEGFHVGMQVAFSQAGVDRGSFNASNYYYTRNITSIDGNNITVNASTGLSLSTGSNIFTVFLSVYTNKDCTVTGVTFDGNSSEWVFGAKWDSVAEIRSGHPYTDPEPANLLITGNRFKNCPGEGVTVGGTNVVVSHNFFKDIQGNPIHMSGLENATIHNNLGINGNLDMKVGHQDGFIAYSNDSKNMVLSENISVNCLRGVGPNNITNGYSKVLNNTFLASRREAIMIHPSREHECIVDGNYIDGYGLSGAFEGIYIGASSKSLTVVNNYIQGGGSEAREALLVRYGSSTSMSKSVRIIGNTILGHCLISALDGAVISNNIFDPTSSTKKTVQIVGQTKGYDLNSCLVNGNVFKNAVVTSGSFGQAESVRASARNLQISNNIFDASTLRPLSYAASGSSAYIKNNTFNNLTGDMRAIAVYAVDGAGSHVEVTGNSFDVVGEVSGLVIFSAASTHSVFNNNTVMSSATSLTSSHVLTISQGELNNTFIMNNIVKNWKSASGFTLSSPAHVINNIMECNITDYTGLSVIIGNIEL